MKTFTRRKSVAHDDAYFLYFSDQPEESRKVDSNVALEIEHAGNAERLWRRFEDRVLDYFKREHPGLRPSAWWKFSAPRATPRTFLNACGLDLDPKCELPEPRRKLSGKGRPAWGVIALAPNLEFGLPADWTVAETSEVAVRDYLLGGSIEDTDPPRHESQAAYLRRHCLLTAEEGNRSNFTPAVMEGDEECGPDCKCGRHGRVLGTGRCGSKW